MKNKITNFKNTLIANKSRFMLAMSGATTALVTTPLNTNATSDTSIASIVGAIADVVISFFPFIGIFFVISGVFKLIMAYRNDQPEAQAGAAKDIVIGAVFIVFATVVWTPISAVLGMGGGGGA